MKHLTNILLIILILLAGWIVFQGIRNENSDKKRYFDSVFFELQRAHSFDSIQSYRDSLYMDSIAKKLTGIEVGIKKTGTEIKRLRNRNEDALNKLDSLMPSVRPDF